MGVLSSNKVILLNTIFILCPICGQRFVKHHTIKGGGLIFVEFLLQQETIFTFLNKIIVHVCTIDTLDTFWNTDV